MKYKLISTDLLLNCHLIPEGSTIELSEEETVGIETYLQPFEEKRVPNVVIPNSVSGSNFKKQNIIKEK